MTLSGAGCETNTLLEPFAPRSRRIRLTLPISNLPDQRPAPDRHAPTDHPILGGATAFLRAGGCQRPLIKRNLYLDLLNAVWNISAARHRKLDELAEIASEEFKGAADVAITALQQIIRFLKELEEKEKQALASTLQEMK